jgi:hypothetical protein
MDGVCFDIESDAVPTAIPMGWLRHRTTQGTRIVAATAEVLSQGNTMAGEELEIEISPDGKVTVRTIGIKGPRCLDAAEMVARLIGTEVDRELTREFYESETHVEQHVDIRERYS